MTYPRYPVRPPCIGYWVWGIGCHPAGKTEIESLPFGEAPHTIIPHTGEAFVFLRAFFVFLRVIIFLLHVYYTKKHEEGAKKHEGFAGMEWGWLSKIRDEDFYD
jgi:hypothetical protein